MRELADSTALQSDQAALRQRLAADGYLFFRRLLRPADVSAAYDSVRAELALGGWTDRDGHPAGPQRAVNVRDALADPSFRAALASRGLNRLAYLPPLRGAVRLILGPGAFSYPVKVLRTVYPESPAAITRGRYIHQDFAVSGVQDMLTTWLPLMDIPAQLGGLAVLPGSHLDPPRRPRLLRADAPGWATTDYRPGDVLLFHCLTSHAALPNHADRLRISADFRWQAADQPAPAEMILGPAAGAGRRTRQVELYSRLLGREAWWEPVPDGLVLQPRQQLATAPPAASRLFAVHPGWQRWRPPAGAVH
ncbi:MAG TPA: phytanoyl-CoA dioxygenase family protein [Streptosporangiaceae bacterium]|nr:phytanoyl-CoA dioxygenase family protein [Streptosporangiaceae bacterium]